jgi:hypothetical protein
LEHIKISIKSIRGSNIELSSIRQKVNFEIFDSNQSLFIYIKYKKSKFNT